MYNSKQRQMINLHIRYTNMTHKAIKKKMNYFDHKTYFKIYNTIFIFLCYQSYCRSLKQLIIILYKSKKTKTRFSTKYDMFLHYVTNNKTSNNFDEYI